MFFNAKSPMKIEVAITKLPANLGASEHVEWGVALTSLFIIQLCEP